MSTSTSPIQAFNLELPESAPKVRITTGLGTATQKSWNLRRPVTLIGSRRPAHIVLHDRKISPAHCVIINTGTEVLLKDLYSRSSTLCSGARVDLSVLSDGDVITISGINIQVAIQIPDNASDDSGSGFSFTDPTAFVDPVDLLLLHTHQRWRLRDAVAMIGRHEAAPILLDHEDVSRRHAMIFRFKNAPAIFDLGGQGGIRINGRLTSLAPLHAGDRIGIGPFRMRIGGDDVADAQLGHQQTDLAHQASPETDASPGGNSPFAKLGNTKSQQADSVLEQSLDAQMAKLKEGILDSWEHLDSWQTNLLDEATQTSKSETDLTSREAELDALDAALRGQLHDIQRIEEKITTRERELEARITEFRREQHELKQRHAACEARESDLTHRADELSRREHIFAQRWTRLRGTNCPHCGKTI